MKQKIKQVIVNGTTVLLFTENPTEDFNDFVSAYENRDEKTPEIELGYEIPLLTTYNFLGKEYKCISLWFDNEDVPDFYLEF